MSTQGSHCKPPANDIIEALTFKQNGASRESDSFQSRFPQLASAGKFSSGNRVWVKPWERNVKKKKKKKEKETEKQAPMRDYREALFADMKAIGKFGLCSRSVTLQVFNW